VLAAWRMVVAVVGSESCCAPQGRALSVKVGISITKQVRKRIAYFTFISSTG
jgi:hypothetical protein